MQLNMWDVFAAFILGCVEGLTEFAPVSSTGHMIIVDDFLFKTKERFSPEAANTFKVIIQLGSILAVIVLMRDRFLNMLHLSKSEGSRLDLFKVIAGLIPFGVLGLVFHDYIDEYLFSAQTVTVGLVLGAIWMMIADRITKSQRRALTESVEQITYKQAIAMGLFQCFALWPGFSRSGSTISGGVIMGMSHRAAADFTFIMAVPIMAGASFVSLLKHWESITMDVVPFYAVGFISAFVVSLMSIRFFLGLINRIRLVPFALYRILLAAVIFAIAR